MKWRPPLMPGVSLLIEHRKGSSDGHRSRRKPKRSEERGSDHLRSRRKRRRKRKHITVVERVNITSTDRWRWTTWRIGKWCVRHRYRWRAGGCCLLRACGVKCARGVAYARGSACQLSRSSSHSHSVGRRMTSSITRAGRGRSEGWGDGACSVRGWNRDGGDDDQIAFRADGAGESAGWGDCGCSCVAGSCCRGAGEYQF